MRSLVVFFVLFVIHVECHSQYDCDNTPCNSYPADVLFVEYWKLANKSTPLVEKLKRIIINNWPTATVSQKIGYFGMTLWCTFVNTEYQSNLSPSCIFLELLKTSIQIESNECTKEEYHAAIKDFSALAGSAGEFGIVEALQSAECPIVYEKTTPPPPFCELDFSVKKFLNSRDFPENIKYIIKSMLQSNRKTDRLTAYTALASMTYPSTFLFEEMFAAGDEMIKLVQLKCCFIKIPNECCETRKSQVTARGEALGLVINSIINQLLSM